MPVRTGGAIFEAGDIAQSAHGFTHCAETRLILHWTCLTEARKAHHHQFGVQCVQYIPAQAEFLQHAGAEIFDKDVRLAQ